MSRTDMEGNGEEKIFWFHRDSKHRKMSTPQRDCTDYVVPALQVGLRLMNFLFHYFVDFRLYKQLSFYLMSTEILFFKQKYILMFFRPCIIV